MRALDLVQSFVEKPMGHLGTIAEFWHVFGEINPDSIREEAERPWRMLILGAHGAGKTTLARCLAGGPEVWFETTTCLLERDFPEAVSDFEDTRTMPACESVAVPCADVYLYVADGGRGITTSDVASLSALRRSGHPLVVFVNKVDLVADLATFQHGCYAALGDVALRRIVFGAASQPSSIQRELAHALVAATPHLSLALARRLPLLRRAIGDHLILETAKINAEFALLSNLPSNIPLVGGLLGGGVDFLVLTKNQAMLLFKLAAIHGRDLKAKAALVAEVAPVIGAAFFWRTVARQAIGMLPSIVSAVPYTAIGYVGTYVVGKMAPNYYVTGQRPSKENIKRFAAEATQAFHILGARLPMVDRLRLGRCGGSPSGGSHSLL